VDNREGNTVAAALSGYLDHLRGHLKEPIELRIASGYFNPGGYSQIAPHLDGVKKIRLLLGAEPLPPPALPLRMPGQPKGPKAEEDRFREAIGVHDAGLRRDRDHLPFDAEHDGLLRDLVQRIRSGFVEVRRYETAFLHGKCYLFGTDDATLVGSSNFTAAGLTSNLELNLGEYQPHVVAQASAWFERLWGDAAPYDLAALYDARFAPFPPYVVYLRFLSELFHDDLDKPPGAPDFQLTMFQHDGVWRAERILERFDGVLIADEVGLGKTFIAGDIIRAALKQRRQRVLVVAPAALRDGPWEAFLRRFQLADARVVSFEELLNDKSLNPEGSGDALKSAPDDYALIVVDEAQAFRNPGTLRAAALRVLLRGTPRKKLVLLSATPVNNSVWDLHNILTLFLPNDAALADRGVLSLRESFARVAATDPEDLAPNALFPIIDATTVRRTRHFVKRYYPGDKIKAPDGSLVEIRFPKPLVRAVVYEFDKVFPGLFGRVGAALDPGDDGGGLTLARYAPERYRLKAADDDAAAEALLGLVRSGLLKRFESSAHAFCRTVEKMIRGFDGFLKGLGEGKVLLGRGLAEIEDLSDTDAWDELISDGNWKPAGDYKVAKLRAAVEKDRALLAGLLAEVSRLKRDDDPKLKKLEEELVAIAKQAAREAPGRVGDCGKVLIFTFFQDTAEWIHEYLADAIERRKELGPFKGRLVGLAGDTTWGGVSRDDALFGFAPVSTEAPAGRDADRFDILVTTDVLAEGMNLQQCRHVVNFDLPWNPMRLVQRHGRIDRIGSPHDTVFVRCFFPDKHLDKLLTLEGRLRTKIATAAATIGVSGEVIPGSATADKAFAETREEIEKLRNNDVSLFEGGGEKPGAHSGEELRHELRKAKEDKELWARVLGLPGTAGSALARGDRKGHVFCARIGTRPFLRFVPTGADGKIIGETLECLRLVACSRKTEAAATGDDLRTPAYAAWAKARANIYEEWMRATDPANIQPKIRPLLREAAEQIRKHPPAGFTQEDVRLVVESLEAPRNLRTERLLREAMLDGNGKRLPSAELSIAIVAKVRELGLEPYAAPQPLPVIEPAEVELVCWIALV